MNDPSHNVTIDASNETYDIENKSEKISCNQTQY